MSYTGTSNPTAINPMVDLTVAIPTYNGATRLPQVLDQLRSQTGTENINWEILIVDNNSKDNTAEIVKHYQQDWLETVPLKYALETQQGAAFARKRAVQESTARLIGFLDDDTVPALDWVAQAYQFGEEHPEAGAYGSQIHGVYEVEPPPNFDRIKPFLAITERGDKPLLYSPQSKILPPSAGLVVRREAWISCIPNYCILTGRVVGSMVTSEDLEVLSYLQQSPWEIWYNPRMEIDHQIPKNRLEKDYLISLIQGIGFSRYVTRMIGVKPIMKPMVTVAYVANDLRKIIRHLLKYGKQVRTDVVTQVELELFKSSLISPYYLWKNGYLNKKQK